MKYIVIDADIKDSRKNAFNKKNYENKIKKINKAYEKEFILPLKIIKGDELQILLNTQVDIFQLIRNIKYIFYPLEIRIGIGVGKIDCESDIKKVSSAWELNGEAFFKARDAIDFMKESKPKKDITYDVFFNTGDQTLDRVINLTYSFIQDFISKWKDETFIITFLEEDGLTHENIARELLKETQKEITLDDVKKERINITKKIMRANWYKIKQTEKMLLDLFREGIK